MGQASFRRFDSAYTRPTLKPNGVISNAVAMGG